LEKTVDILEFLQYINPVDCDYQTWINVGMALKYEGYSWADWDQWSQRDGKRYHRGECERKWKTFEGSGTPVTGGTIVQLANENGWKPIIKDHDHELGWDDVIKAIHASEALLKATLSMD